MTEKEIRANWKKALESVENGWDLSAIIGWGFNQIDLQKLGNLHHQCPELQQKIVDLLEDCNFHTECGLLYEGKYGEYWDYVKGEYND